MEIVIENPVESSPPPPPPPPPPQPLTSAWNAIVSAPTLPIKTSSSSSSSSTSLSSSLSSSIVTSCASMPAATTVMTITIAENPTAPTYPPVRFSYRETYATNSLPFTANDLYSARCGQQPRARSYDDPDGASPSVRRIDKSGLLGIAEPETTGLRVGLRSPRYLTGANTAASGIVSPRRFECVGQLDPVPEVPGQTSRANVAPGSPNAFPVVAMTNNVNIVAPILGQDGRDGSRLDPCDMLSVVNLERPVKSSSFDSLEPRYGNDLGVGKTMHAFERNLDGIESSDLGPTGYGSPFRYQENCETRGRSFGRLSRFSLTRNERDNALESVARYSETRCNFPFAVRTPTAFPGFEGTSSLPSTRATTTTATTSTTTVAMSSMREIEAIGKEDEDDGVRAPEEERAEAEGCEHGSTSDALKDEESSQRADELADNDGIQTLRVIILSEQL